MKGTGPFCPDENSGWCQMAATQRARVDPRSWRSHWICAEPSEASTLLFNETMCQLPTSKL